MAGDSRSTGNDIKNFSRVMTPEQFYELDKQEQMEVIWDSVTVA